MKKSTLQSLLVLIIALTFQAFIPFSRAQNPEKMSYQAVIRNIGSQVVANHAVEMRISILQGSETGTVVYTETQNTTTNSNGLVSIEIGGVSGFDAIDWANGPYYIKTETDPSGGTSYTINGVSQLLSVPYALFAKNVENDKVNDADADPVNEIQELSKSGNLITLSKGGGSVSVDDADADPTNEIQLLSRTGNTVTLSKGGGNFTDAVDDADADPLNEIQIISKTGNTVTLSKGGGSFTDAVDDADADPTNEIQALSISGTSLTLSKGGGTVTLPTSSGGDNWGIQTAVTNATLEGNGLIATPLKIAQQGATAGQALKWNGTSWLPGTDIASGSAAGGDLGGTYPNPAVTKIQGVNVSNTTPETGQVLSYNGSSWAPITTSTGLTLPFVNSSSYSATPFQINNTGTSVYTISGVSSNGIGIYGSTGSSNGSGVFGKGTGNNISVGVYGHTGESIVPFDPGNTGVLGQSDSHFAVAGTAFSGTGGYFTSTTGLALNTVGKVKLTGIGEAAGRVLTCDATGLANWQAPEWQKSGNNVYYDSGHVGIGITAGTTMYSMLELDGNAYQSDIHIYNDGTDATNFDGLKVGYGSYGYLWNYENTDLIFGTNSLERLTIKANGNIGMGTSMPNYKLDIAGNLNLNRGVASGPALSVYGDEAIWYNETYFSWGYGGTWNYFRNKTFIGSVAADPGANMLVVNGAAAKPGGGSWTVWSDIRLKDIHGYYEKGLNEIILLQPVKFTYKEGNPCNLPSDQNYVGFVAQEVQKIFPEAVSEGNDGYLTLDANAINIALVNAIKELKAENEKLKAENGRFNSRLSNLEKVIEASAMK